MNIIDSIKSIMANINTARSSLSVGWSEPPRRTTDLWLNYFHTSPMLNPISMIATDVAGTNFKVFNKAQYRKDPQNAEPFGEHLIYDLLDNPMPDHPEIDFLALMYTTCVYYELTGESFWLIDRDARGKPCGIYIIPPNWCLLTPTQHIPFFRIQPMGNTSHMYFNADPSDVVWFKMPNIVNPYGRGRATAERMGDETETFEFASKWIKNFYYNQATPAIILEMPGITPDGAKAFKESWTQMLGGILNSHKPAVVGQKDFKVHQLSTSPKEMDFLESRKYLIQMANESFCVPPEMRGNLQNSNRATIDSAYYLWTKNVVSKRLKLFASILNKQFVPMFDKTLIWKFDEIVPEDNEFKMKTANEGLTAGTLTRNEWRKIATSCGVTLLPDEGRGDVYLTSLMLQETPANETAPEPVEPEEPEPDAIPVPVPEPEKAIDLDVVIKELNAVPTKYGLKIENKGTYSEEQKTAIWKIFDKSATAKEDGFIKAVVKFAVAQNGKVASAVKSVKEEDDIKKALDSVFNDESNEALKRSLAPSWIASMEAGRKNADDLLGKKKAVSSVAVTNVLFNKWVNKAGLLKAKEINETTYEKLLKDLQGVMSESVGAGDGIAVMVGKLLAATENVYDNMSKSRAVLIARTESASSMNFGTVKTYETAGVEKKTWLSTRDDRTRSEAKGDEFDHSIMMDVTVGINEKFDVGGEMLDYPGDPEGSAGNICNCRCTIIGEFD